MRLPVAASHRYARPSSPDVTISLPPAANAMLVTGPVWSVVGESTLPEGASHTTGHGPAMPHATTRSLSANARPCGTVVTGGPSVGLPAGVPSAADQRWIAPSPPAA